jgi:hypothetical protein
LWFGIIAVDWITSAVKGYCMIKGK